MQLIDHPRPSQPGETAIATSLTHSSPGSFSPNKKTAYKKTPHHKCSWVPVQIRPRSSSVCSVSSLHLRSVLTQSPVQLCTQNTLVRLKGKEHSTQQEAEGANRAHSWQDLHLWGMISQVLQQHSCRAIKTPFILLQQCLLIKTLLLILYFIELGEEEMGLPSILLIFDSVANWLKSTLYHLLSHYICETGSP